MTKYSQNMDLISAKIYKNILVLKKYCFNGPFISNLLRPGGKTIDGKCLRINYNLYRSDSCFASC